MSEITLDQAIDTVSRLPFDQQVMLVDILRRRLIEARRDEMAREAELSLAAFRQGELHSQSADDAIAELHQRLDEPEE